MNIGIFQELENMSVFNSVKPFLGSVQWENGQDFCPDILYIDSFPEASRGISLSNVSLLLDCIQELIHLISGIGFSL